MTDTPKGEDAPNEGGRPPKYDPDFPRQAKMFCERGAIDAELAELFQVSPETIRRWKLEHPEFCAALKVGKGEPDERVVRSLFHNANGYDYYEEQIVKFKTSIGTEDFEIVKVLRHKPADTTAQIYWTKNRLRDEWRDHTSQILPGFTPEQLATLVGPPQLSPDEAGPANRV